MTPRSYSIHYLAFCRKSLLTPGPGHIEFSLCFLKRYTPSLKRKKSPSQGSPNSALTILPNILVVNSPHFRPTPRDIMSFLWALILPCAGQKERLRALCERGSKGRGELGVRGVKFNGERLVTLPGGCYFQS